MHLLSTYMYMYPSIYPFVSSISHPSIYPSIYPSIKSIKSIYASIVYIYVHVPIHISICLIHYSSIYLSLYHLSNLLIYHTCYVSRWLQPDRSVDPDACDIEIKKSSDEYQVGKKMEFIVRTRDQDESIVFVEGMNVSFTNTSIHPFIRLSLPSFHLSTNLLYLFIHIHPSIHLESTCIHPSIK